MNPNDNFSAALAQMPSPEALEGLNTLSKLNPAEISISVDWGMPNGFGFSPTYTISAKHLPTGLVSTVRGPRAHETRNRALDELAALVEAEREKAADTRHVPALPPFFGTSDATRPVPDRAKRARDLFVALNGQEPETPPVLDDVIAEACFELRKARQAATGTEARVCADIAERQTLGRSKYGTTVEENPLPLADWIRHAYEEVLDLAIYLKRAGEELAKGQA